MAKSTTGRPPVRRRNANVLVRAKERQQKQTQLASLLVEMHQYLGFSQAFVAAQVGLRRSALSDIEHGARQVEAVKLYYLEKLYCLPMNYCFEDGATFEKNFLQANPDLRQAIDNTHLADPDRQQLVRFAAFLQRGGTSADALVKPSQLKA